VGIAMTEEDLIENNIEMALRWVRDLQIGEMIECPGYDKTYMAYSSISQEDLNFICKVINEVLKYKGITLRIYNSMGELRPSWSTDNLQLSCAECPRWGVGVIAVKPCKCCAGRQFLEGIMKGI